MGMDMPTFCIVTLITMVPLYITAQEAQQVRIRSLPLRLRP